MAEEEVQESVAAGSTPKKKKKSPLMMILIMVVAAGLAGGAGFYFYSKTTTAPHAQTTAPRDEPRQEKKEEARGGGRNEAKGEIGPIVSLEPFVMNVSGSSSRFVKMAVALEVKDAKLMEEVKKMTPAIRDAMLGVLGAKAPEAFMDVAGRDTMKKELFDSVSGFFKKGDLQAVYITDVIMQ
jgi:flagellar protein FliL